MLDASECVDDPSWLATTCGHELRCGAGNICEGVCPGPGDLCGTCPEGYTCAGDVGFFCIVPPATGQACYVTAAGNFCGVDDYCDEYVCAPRLPDGEACDVYDACVGDCRDSVCVPVPRIGDPCEPDYESCAQNLVCSDAGVCEPWQCPATAVK